MHVLIKHDKSLVISLSSGCELFAFCGALFGICSMITLTVIAIDRYFVITRPLTSIGVLSRKRALLILTAAWTYSLGWSLPPFFGWSEDTHTNTHTFVNDNIWEQEDLFFQI